jgi:hypothetical protein
MLPFEAGATHVAPRTVHASGDSAARDAMLKVMAICSAQPISIGSDSSRAHSPIEASYSVMSS